MKSINILKYRLKNNCLEIALEENANKKNFEVLFVNRETKKEAIFRPLIEKLENQVNLKLDLTKVDFNGAKKNVFDLFILINNNKYRINSKSINLKNRADKHLTTFYKINSARVAVPYLTIKNNLSILYGNVSNVFKTYCHRVNSQKPVRAITKFEEDSLIVKFDNFTMIGDYHFLALYDYKNACHFAISYDLLNSDPSKISVKLQELDLSSYKDGKAELIILQKKRNTLSEIRIKNILEDKTDELLKQNVIKNSKAMFSSSKLTDTSVNNQKVIKSLMSIDEFTIANNNLNFRIDDLKVDDYDDFQLYFKQRNNDEIWAPNLQIKTNNNESIFSLDLADFIEKYSFKKSRWDLYLELRYDNVVEVGRLGFYNLGYLPTHERYFKSINSKSHNVITPYLTINNGLTIVVKPIISLHNEILNSNVKLTDFDLKRNKIYGQVFLELEECDDYTVNNVSLKYRSKLDEFEYRSQVEEIKVNKNKSTVNFQINIEDMKFEQFYWDVFLVVLIRNNEFLVKVKNPDEWLKKEISQRISKYSYKYKDNYILYPYITINNSLALTYRKLDVYENKRYRIKEYFAGLVYMVFKKHFDRKQIWLVYEKFSQMAQDNGYYFFQYVYNHQPNENVYYVIDKKSQDYKNLIGMQDKVVQFMSFKHLLYLYASKLLISSESKGHAYVLRKQNGKIPKMLQKKKMVFLQHGVIALKKVGGIFNKNSRNAADLFVVSSEYESEIIENNFGYDNEEIINVGLCRWDALVDESQENSSKEMLLMPTWRSWLDDVSDEVFIKSNYYHSYITLLNSNKLQQMLKNHNIIMNFYIHPKFREYISRFEVDNPNIRIYQFGEEKLNKLLMKNSLLITDYSSVAWDQFYQKKPVVFYQFDYSDYELLQGSYMDMNTELFGDRVIQPDELINLIEEYIDRNFTEKEHFAAMRNYYFDHVDKNNSERTYKAIKDNKERLGLNE